MSGESQQVPTNEPDPTTITTEIITKEINHLHEKVQGKLDALDVLLQERDRRYTERFDGQQLAVKDAFEGAQAAVAAAFQSSEKAILKAEVSIEKRADATYVSLQELSRSLAVLMPRAEVEARLNAISDQQGSVNLRVERMEAVKAGSQEQVESSQAKSGNVGLWIGLAVSFVFGLVTIGVSLIVAAVVVANYVAAR